jgi:hypothetical protein
MRVNVEIYCLTRRLILLQEFNMELAEGSHFRDALVGIYSHFPSLSNMFNNPVNCEIDRSRCLLINRQRIIWNTEELVREGAVKLVLFNYSSISRNSSTEKQSRVRIESTQQIDESPRMKQDLH